MKFNFYQFLILFFLFRVVNLSGQTDTNRLNQGRLTAVLIGSGSIYGASLVGLNELWYKNYPSSSFHFFDDNAEWNQMDKVGHCFTAYYESLIGMELLKWSGLSQKKSVVYGGLLGFLLQTPIEVLDGYSTNWGASWGDVLANTLGSSLVIFQQLAWEEQKFRLKFSYSKTPYPEYRPALLGSNLAENVIKDYNGQTYWVSTSVNNLLPQKAKIFPVWLDISLGYGSEGMLGAYENPSKYRNIQRYRQYYLSLDINTLKINTKNKFLKFVLIVASVFKIPMPTLEYNSQNEIDFHYIYF